LGRSDATGSGAGSVGDSWVFSGGRFAKARRAAYCQSSLTPRSVDVCRSSLSAKRRAESWPVMGAVVYR
jgi:hypothetical protein